MSEITIRGRISTTTLRRGETATVEHTDTIDRLIAGGWVEMMVQSAPEPESVNADEGQKRDELEEPGADAEPAPEARKSRKRPS